MNQWIQSLCIYVVIGMGIGFALLLSAYIYWRALEKIINIVGIKKDLIQFLWDRNRSRIKPKEKME